MVLVVTSCMGDQSFSQLKLVLNRLHMTMAKLCHTNLLHMLENYDNEMK